jgi:hypothetical protein
MVAEKVRETEEKYHKRNTDKYLEWDDEREERKENAIKEQENKNSMEAKTRVAEKQKKEKLKKWRQTGRGEGRGEKEKTRIRQEIIQ